MVAARIPDKALTVLIATFEEAALPEASFDLGLNPDQIVALYATYSNINIRPDREDVLAELRRIAREEFQCRVTRNM